MAEPISARSWLFAPGDSEKKMTKAMEGPADIVLIDLEDAIARAARYARERVVFGRPIGMNQGIQHPLANCWAQLEAANLMVMKAATLFDKGEECGVEANAGKYLAAEAAFEACHTAMLTMGGMGYAQEYHVERLLREVLIPRTAPVSPHMILNVLAEKVLELPRSY
jgi:acyl-CoA dehydrogenase